MEEVCDAYIINNNGLGCRRINRYIGHGVDQRCAIDSCRVNALNNQDKYSDLFSSGVPAPVCVAIIMAMSVDELNKKCKLRHKQLCKFCGDISSEIFCSARCKWLQKSRDNEIIRALEPGPFFVEF